MSPTILAIDPGTTESAYVTYNASTATLIGLGKMPNNELRGVLAHRPWHDAPGVIVCEMIESYGMRFVGAETYETCVWIGRFIAAAEPMRVERIFRTRVKEHLLGARKGKDSDVNQALADRFGGTAAKGTKRAPGPLYGVAGDIWAALAVAVTWADLHS